MQTDPIGFRGGMNIYAYVLNDPVNFVDPSGLEPKCLDTPAAIDVCGRRERPDNGASILGLAGNWSSYAPSMFTSEGPMAGGVGGGEAPSDTPTCPAPSNVSLTGTVTVLPAGPAYFSGTLTDVSTGRAYSVNAIGYGGGLVAGTYDVTATVGGFGALSNGLDISFANLPFGAGGARFTDNNGRSIGQGSVSTAIAFPYGAGAASFDPPRLAQTNAGNCR